ALVAIGQLFQAARPAAASTRTVATPSAQPASNLFTDPPEAPGLYAPPPLLNVQDAVVETGLGGNPVTLSFQRHNLYEATDAQQESLANLEDQAIRIGVPSPGLPSSDYRAVQTWGRKEALAELYRLLMVAIDAPARTTDQ